MGFRTRAEMQVPVSRRTYAPSPTGLANSNKSNLDCRMGWTAKSTFQSMEYWSARAASLSPVGKIREIRKIREIWEISKIRKIRKIEKLRETVVQRLIGF